MEICTKSIKKVIDIKNNKIISTSLFNLCTGSTLNLCGYEFAISYKEKKSTFCKLNLFTSNDCEILSNDSNSITFKYENLGITWEIILKYNTYDFGVIKKNLKIKCSNSDVFIDFIDLDSFDTSNLKFTWTIPEQKKRVLIPAYITTLGQPIYVEDFYMGLEFPVADNRIKENKTHAKYYLGRTFSEVQENGIYQTKEFLIGSGKGARFDIMRKSFFEYLKTIIRPARFRVQFNSWYDHMLDITSDKIKKSFTEISDGFKKAGYRPLDCYVVDDGWTDYKHPLFWEFDKNSFENEFYNESKLTKDLNSTFGLWLGPRGGYTTQTVKYAGLLTKIGYHKCNQSFDICTGDPNYIRDVCNRLADFTKKYNATYFKIDGFAITPCHSSHHGHPKGQGDGLYFYTFLWEEWIKGFIKIREACPDVFLNITSYAHCSPWFLVWCDAVWINNCQDMGYVGKGSNLDQCLNYRDGKYKDFFDNRELQFPTAYIYNHEPCYAERNTNPTMPKKPENKVVYTYEEFEKYMYMCMMRGTGFVELYFSPSMFDDKRYKIAADVLTWAEDNFDILQNSQFFGDKPEDGSVYGYYAINGNKAIMSIRNSSNEDKTYMLDNSKLSFMDNAYEISEYYPEKSNVVKVEKGENYEIKLKPYDAKIYYINLI